MRSKFGLAVTAIVIMGMLFGCGNGAVEAPADGESGEEAAAADGRQTEGVVVPEWAPENPSPEFLRAAKVVKPMPEEEPAPGDLAAAAAHKRGMICLPALYEFFGSLSNEQIQEFIDSGEVRLPVKEMTATQREALERVFDKHAEAYKEHESKAARDLRVLLYKAGATEEMSNVEILFSVKRTGGHMVAMSFIVRGADGKAMEIYAPGSRLGYL